MQETRWLEIERRLRSAELRLGDVDAILKAIYDRSMQLSSFILPYEYDDEGPVYPPGTCHDVGVRVYWNGVPNISRDIPGALTDANCSNSTWIGIAPGANGWPDVLDTFQQSMTYNGTTTLLESYEAQCSGGSSVFARVPGFTPPLYVDLPVINANYPVTIGWNLTIHSNVPAVHDARNDGLAWTYANGGSIAPYNKQFVSGTSNITVTNGTLASSATYTYGNSVMAVCQITGPETGNITIAYNRNSPQNINQKYEGKFRLTLMDYNLTQSSGPDPANAVYHIDQVMLQVKNKQVTLGQNGNTCDSYKGIRFIPANWSESQATYGNVEYLYYSAEPSGQQANYAASMDLLLARRLPDNNPPTVKWSSCDANTSVWGSLPVDIKWSGPGSINPWDLYGQWNGNYPFEDIGGFPLPVGPSHTLANVSNTPFSTMTEEWWTGNITIAWRTVYASYAAPYSYANLNVKWKVEGPV